MSRSNQQWITELGQPGFSQEHALADLRSELLRRLKWGLASYARADDAFLEDSVQDALVKILSRLGQFEGRSKFLTWASTVAIRIALSELRRRKWKVVSLDQILESAGSIKELAKTDPAVTTMDSDGIDDVFEVMHRLISNSLTERQRTALVAELKGMPQDEIARHLGSNRNAIYKLTHDARKKLKKGLEEAGIFGHEVLNSAAQRDR